MIERTQKPTSYNLSKRKIASRNCKMNVWIKPCCNLPSEAATTQMTMRTTLASILLPQQMSVSYNTFPNRVE